MFSPLKPQCSTKAEQKAWFEKGLINMSEPPVPQLGSTNTSSGLCSTDLSHPIHWGFISSHASRWELTAGFFRMGKKDHLWWRMSWEWARLFGTDVTGTMLDYGYHSPAAVRMWSLLSWGLTLNTFLFVIGIWYCTMPIFYCVSDVRGWNTSVNSEVGVGARN